MRLEMSLHIEDSNCRKRIISSVVSNWKPNFNSQVATIIQHTNVNSTSKNQKGIDTTNPPILDPYDMK